MNEQGPDQHANLVEGYYRIFPHLSLKVLALIAFVILLMVILYTIFFQPGVTLGIFTPIFQTQLLGVIVGGALTLGSSYLMFSLRNLKEMQNIARGFVFELRTLHDWNQDVITTVSALQPKQISFNFINDMNRPIIGEDSLIYTFRKEMFSFNENLVEKMLWFYSHLKAAEEERTRIRYYALQDEGLVKNFEKIVESQAHLIDSFKKAHALIPEITVNLTAIMNRRI